MIKVIRIFCIVVNDLYFVVKYSWIDGKKAAQDVGYHGSVDPMSFVKKIISPNFIRLTTEFSQRPLQRKALKFPTKNITEKVVILKIERGSGGKINRVNYEGTLDGVDFRYVRSISYWVYLEPIAGITDKGIETADVFKVAYDDSFGNY